MKTLVPLLVLAATAAAQDAPSNTPPIVPEALPANEAISPLPVPRFPWGNVSNYRPKWVCATVDPSPYFALWEDYCQGPDHAKHARSHQNACATCGQFRPWLTCHGTCGGRQGAFGLGHAACLHGGCNSAVPTNAPVGTTLPEVSLEPSSISPPPVVDPSAEGAPGELRRLVPPEPTELNSS